MMSGSLCDCKVPVSLSLFSGGFLRPCEGLLLQIQNRQRTVAVQFDFSGGFS